MKQVSLAYTPEEAKNETGEALEAQAPAYPYGTSLCLEDETLKTLGVKKMPQSGALFSAEGTVKVVGWDESEYIDAAGKPQKRRSLRLQFLSIGFEPAEEENGLGAQIYGKSMTNG